MKRLIIAADTEDWRNYGDVDPFEYGRFVKLDDNLNAEVLYIEPVEDNLFECAMCYITKDDVIYWLGLDGENDAESAYAEDPTAMIIDYIDDVGPDDCSPNYIGSNLISDSSIPLADEEEVQSVLDSIGY